MFKNYENYLNFLDKKLNRFFKKQEIYIKCQKGCAKCCKNADFPFSFMEFQYLIQGSLSLEKIVQEKIDIKIKQIIEQKKNYKGNKFLYDCPFLIDNICSLYKYRGIVCRTFGLIESLDNEKDKIPFCAFEGLNFSQILDKEKSMLSEIKYKELGYIQPPLGFKIGYSFLTCKEVEENFNIKFGDKKPLIDWFIEDGSKKYK